jgi:lipopolysaccharide transport system ATP-binding protein
MGRAEIKRKFDEIVDFAEIEKFLDTPVKRYSSGMYVRLAFAVAAHLEPEILIVDEVLAVGDAQFQKKCLGKMEDVSAKEGRTVLFVSHNMGAVRSLCNRGILLAIGQVDYIGSPAAAIDRYQADIQDTHESAFMLHALKRYGHIGVQLRITRVLFNDGSGILHGKPLKIDIYFECLSAVDDVSLGIGFCNRDGVRIITIDSDINGVRANFLKGDAGLATVIVPQLHLEPDIYAIDVGARSGDTCALDYLPQCGHIAVMPSNVTSPVIAFREPGRGGMRLPTEWSFVLTEGDRHW